MPGYGYSYLSDRALVAFLHDLSEGAWKPIAISKYDNESASLGAAALDVPQPVLWKLRLTWAIRALMNALGSTSLAELDATWDACQRRLYHKLAAFVDDPDTETRQAATRLQGVLLQDGGTGQTILDYHGEVDFGRKQLLLVAEGQGAADVKKLKLGALMQQIEQATEALAQGLGRKAGSKRSSSPSLQQREALIECTAAFNAVHEMLDWVVGRMQSGPEKEKVLALRAPFEALLARAPAPAAAPVKTAASPAAAPTPAPAPAGQEKGAEGG